MNVSKNSVVTIQYSLHVAEELVDKGELDYLHGHHNIVVGLEEALEGKAVGEQIKVAVSPEKGYGIYDPSQLQIVSKDDFPPGAELDQGAQYYAESADGQPMPFTILNVEGEDITIDFNHVLAGEVLNFEVIISAIRAASGEEIAHGHAHGANGHDHE